MTPQQKRCLDAIERLTKDGVPPSYDELKDELGLASKSGVHRLIHALAGRGYIALSPGRYRTMQVVTRQAEEVPFNRLAAAAMAHVLAKVSAGKTPTIASTRGAMVRAFHQMGVE